MSISKRFIAIVLAGGLFVLQFGSTEPTKENKKVFLPRFGITASAEDLTNDDTTKQEVSNSTEATIDGESVEASVVENTTLNRSEEYNAEDLSVQQIMYLLGYTNETVEFYKNFGFDLRDYAEGIKLHSIRIIDGNLMTDTMEQHAFRIEQQQKINKYNGVEVSDKEVSDMFFWASCEFFSEEVLKTLVSEEKISKNIDYEETIDGPMMEINNKLIELAEKNSKDSFASIIPLISGFKAFKCCAELEEILSFYIQFQGKDSVEESLAGYTPKFGQVLHFATGEESLYCNISEIGVSGKMAVDMIIFQMVMTDISTGETFFSSLAGYYTDLEIKEDLLRGIYPYAEFTNQISKVR